MTVTRTIHPHIDAKGLLAWKDRDLARFKNIFTDNTGKTATTVADIRRALVESVASGDLCIPFGAPCEGFSPRTGCPGHEKVAS